MKRSPSLAALSRDHHQGLAVAQQLVRATPRNADQARARFLAFWHAERPPPLPSRGGPAPPRALARHARPDHEAVVRLLVDHVELRRRAADLEAEPQPSLSALHQLGERLRLHIRHEERVLFPLVEQAPPQPELIALGAAIELAKGRH